MTRQQIGVEVGELVRVLRFGGRTYYVTARDAGGGLTLSDETTGEQFGATSDDGPFEPAEVADHIRALRRAADVLEQRLAGLPEAAMGWKPRVSEDVAYLNVVAIELERQGEQGRDIAAGVRRTLELLRPHLDHLAEVSRLVCDYEAKR